MGPLMICDSSRSSDELLRVHSTHLIGLSFPLIAFSKAGTPTFEVASVINEILFCAGELYGELKACSIHQMVCIKACSFSRFTQYIHWLKVKSNT